MTIIPVTIVILIVLISVIYRLKLKLNVSIYIIVPFSRFLRFKNSTMHFCSVCSNMYYISITPENELQYYCRNCGNIDNTVAADNICVSRVNVKHTTTKHSFSQVVNKYTKFDPTLPRIHTIRCPNDECPSNQAKPASAAEGVSEQKNNPNNEIIYVRYDDTNLKYVYLCAKCDKVWNTEQQ